MIERYGVGWRGVGWDGVGWDGTGWDRDGMGSATPRSPHDKAVAAALACRALFTRMQHKSATPLASRLSPLAYTSCHGLRHFQS